MATSPITTAKESLPRSLDVNIQISRPQTEIATDMSLMCFLSGDVDFLPDNSRVQYFSTMNALESVVEVGSATWFAGNAFFSQTPRPETMAVGRIFKNPQPAGLVGGSISLAALKAVSDGAFALGANVVDELDFSAVSSLDDVVSVLSLRLPSDYVVRLQGSSILVQTRAVGDGVTIP